MSECVLHRDRYFIVAPLPSLYIIPSSFVPSPFFSHADNSFFVVTTGSQSPSCLVWKAFSPWQLARESTKREKGGVSGCQLHKGKDKGKGGKIKPPFFCRLLTFHFQLFSSSTLIFFFRRLIVVCPSSPSPFFLYPLWSVWQAITSFFWTFSLWLCMSTLRLSAHPSLPSGRIPLYFYFILQWGVYVMQLSVRTFISYTDINFRSFPRSFPHAMCDAMGGFTSTLLFGLQFVKRGWE